MSTTLFRKLAPVALVAAVFAAASCPKPQPGGGVAVRPECPLDSIVMILPDGNLQRVGTVAASGPISLVPEFHDCQRFVMGGLNSYGPLVAVFASSGLENVADPPPATSTIQPTHVPSTGYNDKAAATILNYDDDYPQLRIQKGINCLYLYTDNGMWHAKIFGAQEDSECLVTFANQTGGTELRVDVQAGSLGKNPPVARWDWDPQLHEHYLGIRCGSLWCEVHNPSQAQFNSSVSYQGPRNVTAKGFYDEQNLAVPGGGTLVPSGVVGTIFPIGDLAANVVADFEATWKQVAMVALSATSPVYSLKFNFIMGPAPNGKTQVFLCKGTAAVCAIPPGAQLNNCGNENDPWWAKIASEGVERFRCVIRRQHPGVSIPGAVRWRWQLDDEDMWIRCPEGCCQIT